MAFNGIPVTLDPYAQAGTIYGINGKAMNPCRKALKDLMKEMLMAIPEVLLARDTPLLEAYNAAIDALASDDLWEKQMQDYLQLQAQKPIYVQPSLVPNTGPNTWPTWTVPQTTTSGGHQQ